MQPLCKPKPKNQTLPPCFPSLSIDSMEFNHPIFTLPASSDSSTPSSAMFGLQKDSKLSFKSSSKSGASSSSTQTSINDVTRSFAASLALAKSKVVDLSHRVTKPKRGAARSFLVAKPLNATPPSLLDLKRFCSRVWVLEKNFQIQERPNNLFVISFDLIKDRNKVLRGGPWWYQQAPIVVHEYNGEMLIRNMAMDTLFFWIRLQNIPPEYEEPENFPGIASLAGDYIEFDEKLWAKSKKVRVRVERKLSDPIFELQMIRFSKTCEEEISFSFENVAVTCPACNLIFHVNGRCPAGLCSKSAGTLDSGPSASVLSFASKALFHGAFRFQGSTPASTGPSIFEKKQNEGVRKPIIIKRPVREAEADALALVPVNLSTSLASPAATETNTAEEEEAVLPEVVLKQHGEAQSASTPENLSRKRGREASPEVSPKKLRVLVADLLKAHEVSRTRKKVKQPDFLAALSAKALGLVPSDILEAANADVQQEKEKKKKRRGRPLGSKNKNPSPPAIADESSPIFPSSPSMVPVPPPLSPSAKGKEVL